MTRLLSLATALSLIAYMSADAAGSGGDAGETDTVDGASIKLTRDDVNNALELAKDEDWTKEQVLSFAHGLVLSGAYASISEALAGGVEEFRGTTGDEGVAQMSALFGDDLADSADDFDYVGDDRDSDIEALFGDLFDDEDDSDDEDGDDDK